MKPIRIYQGEDRDIIFDHDDSTLVTATEIEVVIDAPSQISKTLTGGGVSAVTASQFTVSVEDTDTLTTNPGEYDIHVRTTSSAGKVTHGDVPRKVRIVDSKFSNTS